MRVIAPLPTVSTIDQPEPVFRTASDPARAGRRDKDEAVAIGTGASQVPVRCQSSASHMLWISGVAAVLLLDRLAGDRMTHLAGEALPRRLLRHPERITDLLPAMARFSCLSHRLPHHLLECSRRSTALSKSGNRGGLPVSQRPQSQPVAASGDSNPRLSLHHDCFTSLVRFT